MKITLETMDQKLYVTNMDARRYVTNMDARRSKSLYSLKKLKGSIATSKKMIDETEGLGVLDTR